MTINIWVMHRVFLENIVLDAVAHGYNDFINDVIKRNIGNYNFRVYKYDGYFAALNSMSDYFMCSMDLLDSSVRDQLFGIKARPVYTKVRNSAPTVYSRESIVKNSLIADGCIIDGTVENSILFRGVKIGKGTSVKNSILMQDTLTGENVYLNCVITDKNVVLRDGRVLSGHETMPFYIRKNSTV